MSTRSGETPTGRTSHNPRMSSPPDPRAAALAVELEAAADAVIALVADVQPDDWTRVPGPGVWSVGKDVEHLLEAAVYHQWIVRMTIGRPVSSRRPQLERKRLTTDLSSGEAIDLLRRRTADGVALIQTLTADRLDLPTRPPRARDQTLQDTIERVLIGHYRVHGTDIARKLGRLDGVDS
jgi:uncharacterized damage-inducible protein DinB